MDKWVIYALISMVFAGLTSVIAKMGLAGIGGELGLAVRTVFVCVFVFGFAAYAVPVTAYGALGWNNIGWLAVSGLTTAVSWIFYYQALAVGEVSTIALIDKGSFIVAVLLAWAVLREPITARVALGGSLIVAGLFVVARR